MSQPSVTAYFNTRKRQASDDLRGKSKVLLLERDHTEVLNSQTLIKTEIPEEIAQESDMGTSPKIILRDSSARKEAPTGKAVRNIQFDSPKGTKEKMNRPRTRAVRARKLSSTDGQVDIRDSFLKMSDDIDVKKVPFEKKGMLSPKKKPATPQKNSNASNDNGNEETASGSLTPKKTSMMERLANENLSLNEIKNRINKSSRLIELRASIARIKNYDQRLEQFQKQNDIKKPEIQKFEKIELEIPVSPQKEYKSPSKILLSPIKKQDLPKTTSPQRQLLFEPKETAPSLVKCSPTKAPAYQKYLSLAESGITALALPYNYRFLAEVFRCVDTVSAMLFNRKELITFNKLKPAVQELLRRNFTLDHLAQIKTIYPSAYTYHQEKHRNFGSVSKQEKYELILTPAVVKNNGNSTPDADNVLKTASESSMGPTILLARRRKFYNILLEKVKDEHEIFLQNLEIPMNVPREKIMRWHPEFDVESCKAIERTELPQPPHVEKATAKDVLDKAKSLFNCGTRMEKALQRLAEANLTSKSKPLSSMQDSTTQTKQTNIQEINHTIVDTPPTTPTTQSNYLNTALKGIPKALLEKVRARQAAKALEAMTRTPTANKEATLYSRLPELAKILRNIFVAEKKGVLMIEAVIQKLDNSFKTKLTPQEMEEHIRLLCKLLPTWISVHNVRKVDYLKLDRNIDLVKVIKRLEILANDKVKTP